MHIRNALRLALTFSACLSLCSTAACHRSGPALDQVQAGLTAAGLKVEGFHPVAPAPLSAQECRQGAVQNVDTLICVYGSLDARARGVRAAEGWVGNAVTGASVTRDLTDGTPLFLLLAVADRGRTDLSGRAIQKITSAFVGK